MKPTILLPFLLLISGCGTPPTLSEAEGTVLGPTLPEVRWLVEPQRITFNEDDIFLYEESAVAYWTWNCGMYQGGAHFVHVEFTNFPGEPIFNPEPLLLEVKDCHQTP